jgi:CRISPR-associated exonuclease Cas4
MAWGSWSLGAGFLLLGIALWLWLRARNLEIESGLPQGRVIYTDTGTWFPNDDPLYAQDVRLVGKPDYLVEQADGSIIPVELKSGRTPDEPHEGHILQLAAYCYLVAENYGRRPEYGIIQYKNRAFAVDYTLELEEDLLDLLAEMHEDLFESDVDRDHNDWQRCNRCGVRRHCNQRLG